MTITLKDVAARSGTSITTVSQVLNGNSGSIRISKQTVEKVWDAARKLNYMPNQFAKSLRTRSSSTIGVVLSGIGGMESFGEIEKIAALSGYSLIVGVTQWTSADEENELKRLANHRVDGLLLSCPSVDKGRRLMLESFIEEGKPVVSIGNLQIDGVHVFDWDRVAAYEQMGLHLAQQGCSRILLAGHWNSPGYFQRYTGLKKSAKQTGMICDKLVPENNNDHFEPAQWESLLTDVICCRKYDAIVAAGDADALKIMHIARQHGIKVPADMAVTGCSNADYSDLLECPLTTINVPYVQVASAAMDTLIKILKDEDVPAGEMLLPAEVIVRSSSLFES